MTTAKEYVGVYLEQLRTATEEIDPAAVEPVVEVLRRAEREGRTVYVVGNGGSASTASHFASDLCRAAAGTGRRGLRALCLTDSVAAYTAMANDTSYEAAFAELLALQVVEGDVLIAISGSGSSPNVLRAVEVARGRGATSVALVGFGGGELGQMVDHAVTLQSRHYGVVEDLHLALCHAISMFLAGSERMDRPGRRPRSSLD